MSSSNSFGSKQAKQTSAKSRTQDLPWIEKYRPKDMSQISSQEQVVQVLHSTSGHQNLPHLLFYGPPGTGKTSTVLALARQLFGHDQFSSRVLELNASDERGIDVIREKVKNFARIAVSSNDSTRCPFKIIILDEADSMTVDAQSALRRTMETYSKVTRFCLICNYVSRIIDPLASRCAKFRFQPLPRNSIFDRLSYIAQQENVSMDPEVLNSIVDFSGGDLRKAIMFLQSAYRLNYPKPIPMDSILEIAGSVSDTVITRIVHVWQNGSVQDVQDCVDMIVRSGYSATQILDQLFDVIQNNEHLSSIQKSKMCLAMGKMERGLLDGADEQLQLLSLLVQPVS